MRKLGIALVGALLMGLPLAGYSEPISFEQAANVTGLAGIQVGFDFDYSYEKIQEEGLQTAIESKLTEIPIFVRVGLPILEIKLSTPYGDLQNNVKSAGAQDFSGIKDIGLGLKTPLLPLPFFTLAVGLQTNFPTADPIYYIFGDGLAIDPYLAADVDLMMFKLHANIGYEYRAGYEINADLYNQNVTGDVTLDPGDAIHFALGAEIPATSLFYLNLELIGTQYGVSKLGSLEVPDSAGRTMSLVPGIRLQKGIFKAKFGVAIPLEEKTDRPAFGFAPRSDWKIIAGASLLFGL
jgi:hypothetical protein